MVSILLLISRRISGIYVGTASNISSFYTILRGHYKTVIVMQFVSFFLNDVHCCK